LERSTREAHNISRLAAIAVLDAAAPGSPEPDPATVTAEARADERAQRVLLRSAALANRKVARENARRLEAFIAGREREESAREESARGAAGRGGAGFGGMSHPAASAGFDAARMAMGGGVVLIRRCTFHP
jgi:hypothetical protein